MIYGSTLLIIFISLFGIIKLERNSFINYFDKETEIYKGMKKIDEDLGGTTFKRHTKISKNKKESSSEDDELINGKKKLKK